jgi:hypothetical protein
LATIIENKPQQYNLSLLNQKINHRLRSRQHEDFCRTLDFENSKIIQFFETRKTFTVVEIDLILVKFMIDITKLNRIKLQKSGRVLAQKNCLSILH